jgi:TPR repeat protein
MRDRLTSRFKKELSICILESNVIYDVTAGAEAYKRGDYATAVKEWRPLAEQGDVIAQYNLGLMYSTGYDIPVDDAESVSWYRLAAAQGHADAQFNLGVMYATGWGVPQDAAEAVRWYRLSADREQAPREL